MQAKGQGQYNGEISDATRRKITTMLECYLLSIHAARVRNWSKRVVNTRVPTFITLTYPATQIHDDNHCKRKHLTPFIQYLSRTRKCAAYFWKAELQKNQNIHFHIMSDTYCEWKEIRGMWNHLIEADDYVSAFEAKHGHRDPNTTDIEAVRDYEKGAGYIAKYVSKSTRIDPSVDYRKIQGRVWGCSDNLRGLAPFTLRGVERDEFEQDVRLSNVQTEWKKINDFCTVSYLEKRAGEWLKEVSPSTHNLFRKHFENCANVLSL